MPFPGTLGSCWASDTWAEDTWDEDAWGIAEEIILAMIASRLCIGLGVGLGM